MPPTTPRLRILSVGGNAVSAFLSWRLQATNACDVTLVWKSGFEAVAQYGISFKSSTFGNERFKPRHVVRTPEEASQNKDGPFDYVLLCVKALPDVYDLAAVIESVVTPQHTCILVNTTHTLGVEAHLEQRFPTNVVLSLVSGAELTQLAASEFEHKGSSEVWVGPANRNAAIPASIQQDMAEALAMTLTTGQVDCKVSTNIRQQQFERMIGPITFHPLSVIFETPSHAALLEKVGVRQMVSDIIDELLQLAQSQDCTFPAEFKQTTMDEMLKPTEAHSIMYQDYAAKRPMEVETYLGSPIKLAQTAGVRVPRIETLYALLHNLNIVNQQRPKEPMVTSPSSTMNGHGPPPMNRMSSAPPPRGMVNGNLRGRGGRTSSMGMGPPPGVRRGGPGGMNGYGRPMPGPNGFPPPPPRSQIGGQSRRGSVEVANDLEEFSHLVMYDDIPEAGESLNGSHADGSDLALRERELMLRQRELALKEQEMRMRRGPPPPAARQTGRGRAHSVRGGGGGGGGGGFDDDDDDEDYFDPTANPPPPMIDPDNFDMLSVTSRRNRKTPSVQQLRKNPDQSDISQLRNGGRGGGWGRPNMHRNRSSVIPDGIPGLHDSLMDDPMMGYSSNRFGNVDRQALGAESRTNSLTAARLDELHLSGMGGPGSNGPYPTARRASQSPGYPNPHLGRPNSRPSPPNGYPMNGVNGRPSPPGMMRQPVPRHPPGQGNSVAPHQVEQHAGVSALPPPKGPMNMRSLTGSASASAGSGDSGASANIDSEPSAHSSQSSFGPRPPIGVQ